MIYARQFINQSIDRWIDDCCLVAVFRFECLQSWEENGLEMLIARNIRDTRKGSAVCMVSHSVCQTINQSVDQSSSLSEEGVYWLHAKSPDLRHFINQYLIN